MNNGGSSMTLRLRRVPGIVLLVLVLFVPAALVAYLSHSVMWLVAVPLGIIMLALFVAALPIKRRVTPDQFADELERHLLGTERKRDWDDTTSVAIADERLDLIRLELAKFDSLTREKDRDELKAIIARLRSGDLPTTVPQTHLTYPNR